MTNEAASLVTRAKEWATRYGDFSNGEEGAVLTAPLRCDVAWENNDADAFAEMFIENGSMLVGDTQLKSRDEIRAYMAEAFAGGWRGSRLTEEPREIRLLTDTVAIAISEGGILRDGAQSLDPVDEVRILWVIVKRDGDWRITSYQTSPIKG
jgi:uncharacterized protein (TIGR02246 family)